MLTLITDAQLATAMATANPQPSAAWLAEWVPLIEREVESFLGRRIGYEEGIVEWFSPSDDDFVLLNRRPVWSVEEVRQDPAGGYGQRPNTFGADTILTPGEDYYLELDGVGYDAGKSGTGTLRRLGQSWGYSLEFNRSLLTVRARPNRGSVKVTYTGGWLATDDERTNPIPGVITAAVAQAAGVWHATLVNVGVVSGENVPGYGWSQVLGVNLGDNIFASVRDMLRSYKTYRPGGGDV